MQLREVGEIDVAVDLPGLGGFLVPNIADPLEEQQWEDVALPVGPVDSAAAENLGASPQLGLQVLQGKLIRQHGLAICYSFSRSACTYLLGERDAAGQLREGVEVRRGDPDVVGVDEPQALAECLADEIQDRRREPEAARMTFTLGGYTRGIEEGWPEEDTYRWIVCQLPRSFHGRSAAEQRAALAERVPLTGTKWDALLAAMVEHVAWLHGHQRPAWVDERERFLDTTWVVADTPWTRLYSVIFAPAAFLRHGAIPDPRDLDARGGERFEWTPWP